MGKYNICIDESCHLEHDRLPVMCIGYIKLGQENYEQFKEEIKEIKLKHKSPTEIKWHNLSSSRLPLYKDLIDYFFQKNIEFRCVLIKNKQRLDHAQFNQGDPNNFYYKTVYLLLNSETNSPTNEYKVLLDLKDSRGRERLNKIEEVFDNKYYGKSPFGHFQHIHSDETDFLQLADLFIGAITYKARGAHAADNPSKAKVEFLQYLEQTSGYQIDEGTEPWATKFNIFDFQPRSGK